MFTRFTMTFAYFLSCSDVWKQSLIKTSMYSKVKGLTDGLTGWQSKTVFNKSMNLYSIEVHNKYQSTTTVITTTTAITITTINAIIIIMIII